MDLVSKIVEKKKGAYEEAERIYKQAVRLKTEFKALKEPDDEEFRLQRLPKFSCSQIPQIAKANGSKAKYNPLLIESSDGAVDALYLIHWIAEKPRGVALLRGYFTEKSPLNTFPDYFFYANLVEELVNNREMTERQWKFLERRAESYKRSTMEKSQLAA